MSENNVKRVFISACEPSADLHCGNLIKAVNDEKIEWVGLGGPNMASAGCELLENTVDKAAMIYNAFGQIGRYYKLIRRISAYLKNNKIDLVVVCDSPAFNFHVAKAAKRAGIKVLFYVAPQLWAWAPWRIRKLRKCCDKLACILPFEEQWFRSRGVDATFVGNPLLDDVDYDKTGFRSYKDFDAGKSTIALMPGSRKAEIEKLWPAMQQIGKVLKDKLPGMKFIVPILDNKKKQLLKNMEVEGLCFEYISGGAAKAASNADFTLVASGSATLQVASTGCPMVVMYQSSKFFWHFFGKWIITIPYLSLVNILASKELVPEFMPYFSSIEPIAQTCCKYLENKDLLDKTNAELIELSKPLAEENASSKTSKIIKHMLTL